jgi:hypothetical protein
MSLQFFLLPLFTPCSFVRKFIFFNKWKRRKEKNTPKKGGF